MAIKVLLVDDTEHIRTMLSHMLTLDGFDVIGLAASGIESIEMAAHSQPDIIVMDYKMPGMDGITATRAIRTHLPLVPVILYTAYYDTELEQRASDAGVSACISKVQGITTLERQIVELCLELVES